MSHITEFEHLKIKLEAIKSATNNFATENCIGKGGFGNVYKGEIVHSKGKTVVAFKRLDRAFGQGNTEFWKEITMLFQYKHENLVLLLGFCDESDEKILVYDYACNRSLDFHLNNNDLSWTQRLKICLGIAGGLAYLHSYEGGQARVLHRDIKSSNILLNENWNAKISDFGLSKFAHANRFTFLFTSAVGTVGYCDPLYAETGLLTKESDVYSLGVVLFEVLCGRLCISNNDDRPLTVLARQCYELNRVDTIIFGNIRDEIDPDSLRAFTQIAYQCLKRDREERPLISTVVTVLEMALEYQTFKDAASSVGSVASLMVAANPSMPHGAGAAGSHGAVQHLIAATPPAMADSEHLMKYARVGSSDDVSAHPRYDDLPKTVLQTLNLGSNVMSMDFHPQQQHILLVGTNVGEISIWKVQRRDQLQHIVPFKVWDITSCSMQFQINMKKNASVSVKRCTWGPDGSVLGVAFSKHIVHVYKYNLQSQELKELLEIDAHDGGVNDIAFAHPYKQLSIVTCGDDKTIKVWDAVGGGRQCMFVGHEAPVYSVCPHYKEHIPYVFAAATDGKIKAWRYDESEPRTEFDALGLCCTTMAYSKDGTRLFTCGTSEEGEAFLAEWDDSIGAVKRLYSGFGKQSSGVVQFETTRNRFLAAGDEFQIKFWDMDSADMLEATNADDELPERPRLRFNKEGSFLAVTTRNNGIKILARSDGNGDGKILARSDGQNMIRRLGNPCIRVIYELE